MDYEEFEEQEEELEGTAITTKMGPTSEEMMRKLSVRYRECQKNHAVGIGGHAVDGCGEFMAAGEEGTLESFKCAACNCHRNFHRKETPTDTTLIHHHHHHPQPQFSTYYRPPPPPPPPPPPLPQTGYLHLTPQPQRLALPAGFGGGVGGGYNREEEEEHVSNPSSSGGGGGSSSKKRFRTKFTAEQKEKMLGFAERVSWRIQKHDESDVESFCKETGLKRNVLKVWMHNNKHTLGKK